MKKNILKLPEKKEKGLLKEGAISGLRYKIFDRGNIEITDGDKTFRKDRMALKSALAGIDYDNIKNGDKYEIAGAGDTDPLIIIKEGDSVRFTLKSKLPPIVKELISIMDSAE